LLNDHPKKTKTLNKISLEFGAVRFETILLYCSPYLPKKLRIKHDLPNNTKYDVVIHDENFDDSFASTNTTDSQSIITGWPPQANDGVLE
jgi:hypothetical protein